MAKIEDILAEFAEGFMDGSVELTDLIQKYNIKPGSELDTLLQLAVQLERVLTQVDPSPEFVEQLRRDLMDKETESLLRWLRQLTVRQQLAAGIGGLTVAAGLYWIARRSSFDWRPRRPIQEDTPILAS